MTSKLLLNGIPAQQAPRLGFAGRPQSKPVLGQRVVVRAEDEKKSAPAKKEGGSEEKKSAPAKKESGGGKDKFVGQYKSGANRDKKQLFLASDQSLAYLDGSLPGDYGFDPLGLMDPEGAGDEGFISPPWLVYGEIYNGRWAMLGVVGCIFPELLAYLGVIPQGVDEMTWFRSGVFPPAGTRAYWADPYALFFMELWLFNIVELRRIRDYRSPGSMGKQFFLGLEKGLAGSGDPIYPGGLFNPLGLATNNEEGLKQYKIKEVKNGRLAMIAMLGFASQATLTNKGPLTNLLDHIADPTGNNILTSFGKLYGPLQ
ncbi:hypothetical protein WJX73_009489 [Symbiochloris irregularis]|uniref:Chlorophyll a-b binding protein, chloroplastic n=1 Tax=Symbiochloris irregularis TaxID=706552 RepID=A0AAW1NG41_9CHLO